VLKTLMVEIDGRTLAMALLPAEQEANLKQLAGALGGKRAALADVRKAERATGYVKGGISPFGQRQALPAVVDRSALDHATVFVSGGRRGLEIELAPGDLVASLDARIADLTR
jgi:Cys-tRNA(Pro)/Cys-tRNA(Cys) deacylase